MVIFHLAIVKFILALNLGLTKPQHNHMLAVVHGIILCAGRKNITQIRHAVRQDGNLSNSTHFLNHAPWCVNRMQRRRMKFMIEKLRKSRIKKGDSRHLVFFIVDDTNSKKDKSTNKMEALEFHYSHEDGKSMWSHNVVTTHVVSDTYSFPWDFRPYFRKEYCEAHPIVFKSKNDLALEMIEAFSAQEDELVYVLMDNWYTSEKVVNACNRKGFHVIAAVKTNRKISPAGIRIGMSDFAEQYIHKSDLRPVTVEGQGKYWVYEYEGPQTFQALCLIADSPSLL
jgi:hypothetical protein